MNHIPQRGQVSNFMASSKQLRPVASVPHRGVKRRPSSHEPWGRMKARYRAYLLLRGITSALKEVEDMEKGIKQPKTLSTFLNEL